MRYFVKSQGSTSQKITTSLTIVQSVYRGRHAKAWSKCPENIFSSPGLVLTHNESLLLIDPVSWSKGGEKSRHGTYFGAKYCL